MWYRLFTTKSWCLSIIAVLTVSLLLGFSIMYAAHFLGLGFLPAWLPMVLFFFGISYAGFGGISIGMFVLREIEVNDDAFDQTSKSFQSWARSQLSEEQYMTSVQVFYDQLASGFARLMILPKFMAIPLARHVYRAYMAGYFSTPVSYHLMSEFNNTIAFTWIGDIVSYWNLLRYWLNDQSDVGFHPDFVRRIKNLHLTVLL